MTRHRIIRCLKCLTQFLRRTPRCIILELLSWPRPAQAKRDGGGKPPEPVRKSCPTSIATQPAGARATARAGRAEIDQGLRSYMLGVYNNMVVGLAITGLVALGVHMLAVTTDPSQAAARMGIMSC